MDTWIRFGYFEFFVCRYRILSHRCLRIPDTAKTAVSVPGYGYCLRIPSHTWRCHGRPRRYRWCKSDPNRVERCTQVCLCDCEEFELQMGPEPPITLGPSTESASKMGHISLSLKTSKYPQTAPVCGYFTTTCLRIPDTAKKLYPYPVCGYCMYPCVTRTYLVGPRRAAAHRAPEHAPGL